ncbi:MAG: glycoside hydrolase family 88 protein [Terracidiphilus sp.]|nr:glycoside hydrolase family 88 protein [Terracidiphilus sp.]
MKRIAIFSLLIAAGFVSVALAVRAQSAPPLPSRAEILTLMHRADAWQLANPVMPAGDRNWERGTWYTGVVEAWKATGDKAFYDRALAWGRENQWQVGTEKLGANRLFCSETWLELYLAEKNPAKRDRAWIEPTIQALATPAPNTPAGAKRWYLDGGRSYIDSLYGAVTLAMLTRATGDPQYVATMRAFFDDVSGELWDKDAGLFYRDNTYIGRTTAHGRRIFWSRGNGWIFAGLARLLEYLPQNDPDRAKYVALYRRMAGELVKRQGVDGFWRANLDDPDDVPNPESSGTAFFTFGFAWGINHHLLDRKTYLPAVQKAYAALAGAVSPEGKVGWGQQVDARPNPAAKSSTHEYVTGTFLLASGEVYRLSR